MFLPPIGLRHSRKSRAWVPITVLVVLVGCGKIEPAPVPSTTALTPQTHSAFPIEAGPHAVDCNTCHGDFPTFKQFTCLGCHTHDQAPTQTVHTGLADYSYTNAACYSCHPDGTQTTFDHPGITGNCASCHDTGGPFAALPVTGFTHSPIGSTDCGGCHTTTNWRGGNAPAGLVDDPQQAITLDALIPTYAATSISRLSAQTETLPMPMAHATAQVVTTAFSACTNCHLNGSTGEYYPGDFHSSLANLRLAQPTACSDCHSASLPTGFVGPLATSPVRTPASGAMKHDAVAWANGQPTTTKLAADDCGVCHTSPSQTSPASWAVSRAGTTPALFHAPLTSAGRPQPSSCVDCHANSRPVSLLTSLNSALPANVTFDHSTSQSLGDCTSCHVSSPSPSWVSWAGGRFHLAGSASPKTCLPCHSGERPTSTATWRSPTYTASPFDYVTNARGIKHGAGQDCVACHSGPGTGAWGSTQNWLNGYFPHNPTTLSGTTCISCHMTQRPDLLPGTTPADMAALLGFDHSMNGTGDCFGCHQATVTANTYTHLYNTGTGTLPNGDWKGGISYPGSTLVGSPNQFITATEITLNRSGANNLVTSTNSTLATLYNEMLHVSTALPPQLNAGPTQSPDYSKCWHCHTSSGSTVTSYADGIFHSALTNYSATPGGTVSPLPQPTTLCTDCHTQMRPEGIVELTASDLQPMDHTARFTSTVTIGGQTVNGVAGLECATCHHSPGNTWADGLFHANIGTAVPQDCVTCHYPTMANTARADLANGTRYQMKHASAQLTFQGCQTCHTTALSRATTTPIASTLWSGGLYHSRLSAQPAACVDCHAVSDPPANTPTQSSTIYNLTTGATATNKAQWMNHGTSQVVGADCVVCHAADAKTSGSAWSKATRFHGSVPASTTCRECHGVTNGGGSVIGTNNNLPVGLTNSSMQTTASANASTGVPAGTFDQITHADINASSHDCNFCHTQLGVSTTPGVQGREWAQALFHVNFRSSNPLIMNGTTGRCSNCHMNVKPGTSFTTWDHSTYTSASGTADCSSCHSWPGTGTATAPNWRGAAAMPAYINVGGFPVLRPPASSSVIQAGINNLPHPAVASGVACTTCHQNSAGGKSAFGYDHLSTLINTNCNSCHEAGSNLIGTAWNNATTEATGAGDTRAYTLPSVVASFKGNSRAIPYPNHFYPVDCNQCHVVPTGNGYVTTGSAYQTAWRFPHTTARMTNPSTCVMCHTNGIPN